MTLDVRTQRREYWANDGDGDELFPSPAFGRRFGMGRNRFEQILLSLSLGSSDDGKNRWLPARSLDNLCNARWQDIFSRVLQDNCGRVYVCLVLARRSQGWPSARMKIKGKPKRHWV